jgi:hypothetical protein
MIAVRFTLSICLILISLFSYGQTSTDSVTCLSNRDIKIINLAFNQLDKYMSLDSNNTKLIATKDAKIKLLEWQFQLRSDQLTEANTTIAYHEKEIKHLKRTILVHKIAVISAIVFTILILN